MSCLEVNNDNDLHKFNKQHKKGVWFVWFYADWCGHCVAMVQPWEDLKNNNKHGVNLAKVRDDYVSRVESNPQVQGYPTIMLYKDGKVAGIYSGERSPESFNNYLGENVNVSNNNENAKHGEHAHDGEHAHHEEHAGESDNSLKTNFMNLFKMGTDDEDEKYSGNNSGVEENLNVEKKKKKKKKSGKKGSTSRKSKKGSSNNNNNNKNKTQKKKTKGSTKKAKKAKKGKASKKNSK